MDWLGLRTDDLTLTAPAPAPPPGLLGTLSEGGQIGADNGDESDDSEAADG